MHYLCIQIFWCRSPEPLLQTLQASKIQVNVTPTQTPSPLDAAAADQLHNSISHLPNHTPDLLAIQGKVWVQASIKQHADSKGVGQ